MTPPIYTRPTYYVLRIPIEVHDAIRVKFPEMTPFQLDEYAVTAIQQRLENTVDHETLAPAESLVVMVDGEPIKVGAVTLDIRRA